MIFKPKVFHIFWPDGKSETIDTILHGNDRNILCNILSDEWNHLERGNKVGIESTDTIEVIQKEDILAGPNTSYTTLSLNTDN